MIRKIKKQYRVGEVAKMAGIDRQRLLDLERDGALPEPRRSGENHRVYSFEEARAVVHRIFGRVSRRIAVVNQKGGVGKTTTTFNLAGALADLGRKVLLVDLDPQANLTASLGVEPQGGVPTVEDLFVDDSLAAQEACVETALPGLTLIPALPRLAGVEVKIVDVFLRETILDMKLQPLHDTFDFILLDCPPNLSLVTINALVAAREALVPIEAQSYSIKAISDVTNTVALIRSRLERGVTLRFLPTKIDGRLKHSREILEAVRQGLKDRVLPPIRTDAHLMRAPMMRAPIGLCFPKSRGAEDYRRLAEILIQSPPDAEH